VLFQLINLFKVNCLKEILILPIKKILLQKPELLLVIPDLKYLMKKVPEKAELFLFLIMLAKIILLLNPSNNNLIINWLLMTILKEKLDPIMEIILIYKILKISNTIASNKKSAMLNFLNLSHML
jgi:hypothetical protein